MFKSAWFINMGIWLPLFSRLKQARTTAVELQLNFTIMLRALIQQRKTRIENKVLIFHRSVFDTKLLNLGTVHKSLGNWREEKYKRIHFYFFIFSIQIYFVSLCYRMFIKHHLYRKFTVIMKWTYWKCSGFFFTWKNNYILTSSRVHSHDECYVWYWWTTSLLSVFILGWYHVSGDFVQSSIVI